MLALRIVLRISIFYCHLLASKESRNAVDWINKTRTLLKELENVKHPGSRIRIIRVSKNRLGENKGQFGERDFIKRLVKEGVLGESDKDRKVYRRFESGEITLHPDKEPVPTVLRLLEITPEFAGYTEEIRPESDTARGTDSGKVAKRAKPKRDPLKLVAYNNLESQSLAILAAYDPGSNQIDIHIFGNEKPDQSAAMPDKVPNGFAFKCLWLREKLVKFADSPDPKERVIMPGKAKVEL